MNCLCLLISPCELILVYLIVKLHNMFYVINYVNIYIYIYACEYINMNVMKWHNTFHMHQGNLEIRCECMT